MRGCCDTGVCMTHLAEGKADYSTLKDGDISTCVPNFGEQEWVISFGNVLLDKYGEREEWESLLDRWNPW